MTGVGAVVAINGAVRAVNVALSIATQPACESVVAIASAAPIAAISEAGAYLRRDNAKGPERRSTRVVPLAIPVIAQDAWSRSRCLRAQRRCRPSAHAATLMMWSD